MEVTYIYADECLERVLVVDPDGVARKTIAVEEVPSGKPVKQPVTSVLVSVPKEITMRQARIVLHSRGHLEAVQAAIDSLEEPPRIAAQIEWDFSSTMKRDNQFVAMISEHLNLSSEYVDEMLIEGSTL